MFNIEELEQARRTKHRSLTNESDISALLGLFYEIHIE